MKSLGSVYIKKESDMFVSDIPLVSDFQKHNMHKRKKHKPLSNGTEAVTEDSDSEASSSQSLLKVRKKKYSEMVGESHFKNDSSTVKKKKKLSIDFRTQEIFKQRSEDSTDSPSNKSNKELNMNDVCGSLLFPVQEIKQEINLDSTMNGLLDVSLTEHCRKKDKTKRVKGPDLSNKTHQNRNTVEFGIQDIFGQPSSEEFAYSTPKKSKKEKHKERNGNSRKVQSLISEIQHENTLNSTTHSLHDVSSDHSAKEKKKDSSTLHGTNEKSISSRSSVPYTSDSSEMLQLTPSCFGNFTPKKSKKKKHKDRNDNGREVQDSKKSLINEIKSENTLSSTTDSLRDISSEHSTKKKKKDKKHSSSLQDADEESSLSCSPRCSSHGNKISQLRLSFDISIDSGDLDESEINLSYRKHKKKKKHKHTENDGRFENDDFFCQFCHSSFSNISGNGNTSLGNGDILSNRICYQTSDKNKSTKKIKKKKREKSVGKASANEKRENVLNLLEKYLSNKCDEDLDFSDSMDDTTNNGLSALMTVDTDTEKKKTSTQKKDLNKSTMIHEPGKTLNSSTSDILRDVCGNNADCQNKLDDNWPNGDNYTEKKIKRKKHLGKSNDSDKALDSSTSDISRDVCDNVDSQDKLDDNWPNGDNYTEKKIKRKKHLGESNDSDKALDSSTSDISRDVCDNVDSQDKLDDNWPKGDNDTEKKIKRKKHLGESNDSDKALDSSTSDISRDVCDNVDSQDKLDDNWPKGDNDTEKKIKRKKHLGESNDSDKALDSSTSDISRDVCDNVDSQDKLDDNWPKGDNDTEKKIKRKKHLGKSNDSDKALDSSTSDISRDVCDNVDSQDKLDDNWPKGDNDTEKKIKRKKHLGESNDSDKALDSSTSDISRDVCDNVDSQDKLDDDSCGVPDQKQKNPNLKENDETSKSDNGLGYKIDAELLYSSDSDEGVEEDDLRYALKSLKIVVDFPVPELHKICNRASKPTPKQRLEVSEHGIMVKVGKFVKSEDTKIKENWKKFIQTYNFEDVPKVFFSLDKKYISVNEKQNFLFFLAQGLNERTPFSVYQRFKLLMGQINRGRFTNEEDKYIKQEIEENGGVRNYMANIALHLNRPLHSVEKRIERLKHRHTRKIRWKKHNMAAFIKYLLLVTGTEPDDIEKLKDRHISSEEWIRLSKKLDKVPPRILMRAWLVKIHPVLFIPKDRCDLRKVKLKLVNLLFENNEHDWRAVNWRNYASHFEGLTWLRIYTLFKTLITSKVSQKKRSNLEKCIKILRKCSIDDLAPHFIYKVKYVNGKIIQP